VAAKESILRLHLVEELSPLLGEVVRRVQVPIDVADWIAEALRESQDDKERFHRTAVMQLQQQYLAVQSKLDRAYDDRFAKNAHTLFIRQDPHEQARLLNALVSNSAFDRGSLSVAYVKPVRSAGRRERNRKLAGRQGFEPR
jgi:hypothetical protein